MNEVGTTDMVSQPGCKQDSKADFVSMTISSPQTPYRIRGPVGKCHWQGKQREEEHKKAINNEEPEDPKFGCSGGLLMAPAQPKSQSTFSDGVLLSIITMRITFKCRA
jgi:hypothetical protein